MVKKILHLTLKKKWFDLIANGEKILEYREMKPYWEKRLLNKDGTAKSFDEIHFRNGYRKDSPFMRIEYNGLNKGMWMGKEHFALHLGKLIELRIKNEVRNDE